MKDEMKTAAIKKGKTGLMFIGVCTAALFIIPAVCSAIIKPVMDAMGMKAPDPKNKKQTAKLDVVEGAKTSMALPQTTQPLQQSIKPIEKPQIAKFYTSAQTSGMKVGGL